MIGTFHIGISPRDFHDRLNLEKVLGWSDQIRLFYKGVSLYLGVDRLDYIKGIPQKLKSFDHFLDLHPDRKVKVTLLQVVVPSRANVDEYHKLLVEIQGLVGEINGKHGTFPDTAIEPMLTSRSATSSWVPIQFIYKSIQPEELTALYSVSDALVVLSTRDGMNLVCYEYVACQDKRNGSIILSKFAGAASTLPNCLVVNPWDKEEVAGAMEQALTMSQEERGQRQRAASKFVNENTA